VVSTDLWRQSLRLKNYQCFKDLQTIVRENLPAAITDGLDTLFTKTGDLGLFKTVEQGATTSVWLASSGYKNREDDLFVGTNVQYYDNCKPQSLSSFAKDEYAAQRL